jgi:nucleoid DNA-binding protein
MEDLIKQVTAKTGISEEQARGAVTTVLAFLKDKLPEPVAVQLDTIVAGGSGNLSDMASKVGGMFTK